MNKLKGDIVDMKVSGNLTLVSAKVTEEILLKAIVIENPDSASYLKNGTSINLLFKETEVIIGTGDNHSISLQNRIPGKIVKVEKGALLSELKIETPAGDVTSVISSNSVERLNLQPGSEVTAMIKLNEVMISEL